MADLKTFPNSIMPLSGPGDGLSLQPIEPQHFADQMTLHFFYAIPVAAQIELERRIASGQIVTPEELSTTFAGDAAQVAKLESWLKQEGFEILKLAPHGTGLYARASAAVVQKALGVELVRAVKDGVGYMVATTPPSVPADSAGKLQGIVGLQPHLKAKKHHRPAPASFAEDVTSGAAQGTPASSSTSTAFRPPYKVAAILGAYNASGTGLTGKGQTIAILGGSLPAMEDLEAFWQQNALPIDSSQVQLINCNGSTSPPPGKEATLDASWASGIASGAQVRVYSAGDLGPVDLNSALDAILADLPNHPRLHQLSVSLGIGELGVSRPSATEGSPSFILSSIKESKSNLYQRLNAAGVNIFISSGDAGSNPSVDGNSEDGHLQVSFASSCPYVIGVGGTSLELASNGQVVSETAWSGSGGGQSVVFTRPQWQAGPGMVSGTARLVPDVSAVADPRTPAFLIYNGELHPVGGTSWAAPIWAGFCALLNEARANAGLPPLPFLAPLLYGLMGTACFRDITAGSNGQYVAGPGYDMVTGIGVPDVAELVKALAATTSSVAPVTR